MRIAAGFAKPLYLLLATLPTFGLTAEQGRLAFPIEEGKVILLDFWASWCGPCRQSFPWLNAMQAKYEKEGLIVIGINVDADRSDAERFLEAYPASFRIEFDSSGELASHYKIIGMPSSVFLDSEGRVLAQHHGFRKKKKSEYEASIVKYLRRASDVSADKAEVSQ